jgi:hypothetical protein
VFSDIPGCANIEIRRFQQRIAMAVDHIRYDLLTQQAMRGLVRTVLRDAAARGLPGEHHFFITFDTRAPGVKLSARLKEQYADEMTIVLQHQFWDLTVGEDQFEVGLSFNGIPERLVVPFAAIKSFADPSVKFGMQFAEVTETSESGAQAAAPQPAPVAHIEPKTERAPATEPPAAQDKSAGGEVVSLDRFRKK